MLSGALLVPNSLANMPQVPGSRADAVQPNVSDTGLVNASYTYPATKPGYTFYVYIDVINVTGLVSYQVGFTFNKTYLQVTNVTEGGFLTTGVPSSSWGHMDGSINNTIGTVSAYSWYLLDPLYNKTGSGHLMKVGMEINPALDHNTGGQAVSMMHFSTTTTDATALILSYADFSTQITPLDSHVYEGYFTISGPVPEFSSVFFATLLVLATFAAALFGKATWSHKRKG